jgi:NhaP-type Na+/H+ or K+/H+ antiporter
MRSDVDNGEDFIFITMMIIAIGAVVHLHHERLTIPYTVLMYLVGLILGLISHATQSGWYNRYFENFDALPPRLLFHIFLPALIFEGSYGIRTDALTRIFRHAALLAGPGLVVNSVMIAAAMKAIFPDWSWYAALLLGTVLSATDPVAVVCLLKDLGIDANFTALVDAEALMNDGSAIIGFSLLLPAAISGEMEGTASAIFVECLQLTVLAALFGLASGALLCHLLQRLGHGDMERALMTLCAAYMMYFIADEILETSGVLTLFTAGVFVARNFPSVVPGDGASRIATIWRFVVHVLNTVLFCLVGVVVARQVIVHLTLRSIGVMLWTYVVCAVSRLAMVLLFAPLANWNNQSYRIRTKEILLLTHGGLRGGVSTVLALMIVTETELPAAVRDGFLQSVCGVVSLSLLVNATTSAFVVHHVGLDTKPRSRLEPVRLGVRYAQDRMRVALHVAKANPRLREANWPQIDALIIGAIRDPNEGVPQSDDGDDAVISVLLMRGLKRCLFAFREIDGCDESVLTVIMGVVKRHAHRRTLCSTAEILKATNDKSAMQRLHAWALSRDDAQAADERFVSSVLLTYRHCLASLEDMLAQLSASERQLALASAWLTQEKQEAKMVTDLRVDSHGKAARDVVTKTAAAQVARASDVGMQRLKEACLLNAAEVESIRGVVAARLETFMQTTEVGTCSDHEILASSVLGRGLPDAVLRVCWSAWVQRHVSEASTLAPDVNEARVLLILRGVVTCRVGNTEFALLSRAVWGAEECLFGPNSLPVILTAATDVVYAELSTDVLLHAAEQDARFNDNLLFAAAASTAMRLLRAEALSHHYTQAELHERCLDGTVLRAPTAAARDSPSPTAAASTRETRLPTAAAVDIEMEARLAPAPAAAAAYGGPAAGRHLVFVSDAVSFTGPPPRIRREPRLLATSEDRCGVSPGAVLFEVDFRRCHLESARAGFTEE